MSAALVNSDGAIRSLDRQAGADEIITEADVQDPAKLARSLAAAYKALAALRRAWAPRRLDFEDVPVSTAGATVSLEHDMGGRVRWHLVGWRSPGTSAPILKEETDLTTDRTLVLMSYVAGTATIRVEEAG